MKQIVSKTNFMGPFCSIRIRRAKTNVNIIPTISPIVKSKDSFPFLYSLNILGSLIKPYKTIIDRMIKKAVFNIMAPFLFYFRIEFKVIGNLSSSTIDSTQEDIIAYYIDQFHS